MGSLALGMAFLLSACGEDNAYTNALPKDAAAVFSFDLMDMAQKCDLNDQAKQSMGQMMKSSLKGNADALVDKLMENPEESGLKLTDRVYFFGASQMQMGGVLVRMADKGKLEDLIAMLQEQKACEAPADGDGCRWTVGGGGLMAWTDDAFMMLAGDGGNPKDLQHQASMWLRQKKGEGYSGTPEFKKLEDADEDVAMVTALDAMPKSYWGPMTMGLPADLNLNDLKLFTTLDFEEGKAVVEVEALLGGKFKELLQKQAEVSGELDGTYLKTFPANTVCWMAANVNGEKAYELLRENPTVRQELDNSMMPLDFEAIFKAVKGDVAVAMPEMSMKLGFILYADVTNSDFMRTFEDLKPMLAMTNGQMRLVNKGENAYQFVVANGAMLGKARGPVSFWLGVKDDRFYLTNQEDLIDREVKGLSLKDCDWAKDVKNKHFYLNVNFQALAAVLPQIPYVGMLDYLSIESDEPTKARMVLQLKNRKENALKQLVQIVNN